MNLPRHAALTVDYHTYIVYIVGTSLFKLIYLYDPSLVSSYQKQTNQHLVGLSCGAHHIIARRGARETQKLYNKANWFR